MLKTREAAKVVGLAPVTVRGLARKGLIPHYRPGKHIRFDEEELRGWLNSRRGGHPLVTKRPPEAEREG